MNILGYNRPSPERMAEILLASLHRPRSKLADFRVMGCYLDSTEPFILAVGRTIEQADAFARAHKRHLQRYGPEVIGAPRWVRLTWREQFVNGEWRAI